MSCVLTSVTSSCRKSPGVLDVFAIRAANIATTTFGVDGSLTAYTLTVSAEWAKLVPVEQSANLVQTKNTTPSGYAWDQLLTCPMVAADAASRKALKDFDDCCDIVFVVRESDGTKRLCGAVADAGEANGIRSYNGRTGNATRNTGTTSTDQNLYSFTLEAKGLPEEAAIVTAAITPIA